MKRFPWFVICVLVFVVALSACKTCKKPGGEVVEEDVVITEDLKVDDKEITKIATAISTPFCKRMIACTAKDGANDPNFKEDDCVKQINDSLSLALAEKPVTVKDDQLNSCVECLKEKCTCADIMKADPPEACAFLK